MSPDLDVAVVGGGPVGLGTAILAAQAGLKAAVFERRRSPFDKACGEGVMPRGLELLRRLGVRIDPGHARPFRGIRFLSRERVAEGQFLGSSGMGIRRTELARALRERALEVGVALHEGCDVRDWADVGDAVHVRTGCGDVRASWLIGADGLHSAVRRRARLALPNRGRPRYGIRRHFAVEPWTSHVEVYWSDTAEAYVTPVGPREVGVAILWSGDGRRHDALMHSFPTLAARLRGALATSPVLGAGPFAQRVRRPFAGRVILVGDAAGYLDPLTGEGLTIGLLGAEALVATLASGAPLPTYAKALRRVTRDYRILTHAMLLCAARPWLRHRLVSSFADNPQAFDRCVAVLGGNLTLETLGVGTAARLLSGMISGSGGAAGAIRQGSRTNIQDTRYKQY